MKRVSLLILLLVSLLVPVEAFSASVTITYSCDTYGEILQCL